MGQFISSVGIIGLGPMGRNFSLNLLDQGYEVVAYDNDQEKYEELSSYTRETDKVTCATSIKDFIEHLPKPRAIFLLVPAGSIVSAVCDTLLNEGLDKDDIIVDFGNSFWKDSEERLKRYHGQVQFLCCGISGGESGARHGPSLMVSGDQPAWEHISPILNKVSAKPMWADDESLDEPFSRSYRCVEYFGQGPTGHFVKMVHNGIEYAVMQSIAEVYAGLRELADLSPQEISEVFTDWSSTLKNYLLEASATVLAHVDPKTNKPFVDIILDKAGQKGTGNWTGLASLEVGTACSTIMAAVNERMVSALKEQRLIAADVLPAPDEVTTSVEQQQMIANLKDAFICSTLIAYAQGFTLLQDAKEKFEWDFDNGALPKVWSGGCIIRAAVLQDYARAFIDEPHTENALLFTFSQQEIANRQRGWRESMKAYIDAGVSAPTLSGALNYYDSYRSAVLPATLIQAQRDYFGAHGYLRNDDNTNTKFHTTWYADTPTERKL